MTWLLKKFGVSEGELKLLAALREGKLATSRLARVCGMDYMYTSKLLNDLKGRGCVECEVLGKMTFWDLTTKGLNAVRGVKG